MKSEFLKLALCLFVGFSFLSLASCDDSLLIEEKPATKEEEHDFGELHEGKPATFFDEGRVSYYYCKECNKYFDANKNEIENLRIPKLSREMSICINGNLYKHFSKYTSDMKASMEWVFTDLTLASEDEITFVEAYTKESIYTYTFNTQTNVTNDGKVKKAVSNASVIVIFKDDFLSVSVEGIQQEVIYHNGFEEIQMNPSSSDFRIYETAQEICKGEIINIGYLDGYYYTLSESNSNFVSYTEDGVTYLKCLLDGWYKIKFNTMNRQITIDREYYAKYYGLYLHTFNESGSNQLMRYNKSSYIYSIEVELDKDKLYYLYGVDVFDPESTIMVGKLESSLGKTVTMGDFDLFQVYESGKYRINYHRIDGNIELMVIL